MTSFGRGVDVTESSRTATNRGVFTVRFQVFGAGCACIAAALTSLLLLGKASAHPHVWVTVETEIQHDADKRVTGFQHKWTFDEFYSSFATQGMDKNEDGKLDREELKELAEVNVTSLKEFGFFTFPKVVSQEIDCDEPRDYWLEHKDGMLTLHFTLPLKQPVEKAKLKDFHFSVYDPTFYVSFAFAKENAIRLASGLSECRPEITRPEAQAPAKSLSESVQSENNELMGTGSAYAENVRLKCGAGT